MATIPLTWKSNSTWTFEECTGGISLGADESARVITRLKTVCLNNDPEITDEEEKKKDGFFQQFYFIRLPSNGRIADKTVLFIGGGPGNFSQPDDEQDNLWLGSLPDEGKGFNVVYFHLRGSGYSQIPYSTDFDRFIRTKFAVGDIEDIRKDLFPKELGRPVEQWAAVVGHSYGTVLAQQYANKHPDSLNKLILIAAVSLHEFKEPVNVQKAYDNHINAVQKIRREIIDKLLADKNFKNIRGKEAIKAKLFGKGSGQGLFRKIEDNFISDQFLIDNYDNPKVKKALKKSGLGGVSVELLRKLRELRRLGWSPLKIRSDEKGDLVDAGKTIFFQPRKSKKKLPKARKTVTGTELTKSKKYSLRVLYVMGIYDGINRKFLKEWLASDRSDFRGTLRRFPGAAHARMGGAQAIQKIGEVPDDINAIKPWDPANSPHGITTLILNGGADIVTAGPQARHYFERALKGFKMLIEIAGAGHDFLLPNVRLPATEFRQICKGTPLINARDCLLAAFIALDPKEFLSKVEPIFEILSDEGLIATDPG